MSAERRFESWLPFVDSYRTLCLDPSPTLRELFEALALKLFASDCAVLIRPDRPSGMLDSRRAPA